MKVAVLLLLLGLSVCSLALLHPSRVSSISRALYAKSKMPSFSEEDQAELERISAGGQMDFSRNLKRIPKATEAAPPAQAKAAPPAQAKAVVKPVMEPNSNWRTALSNPPAPAGPVQVQRNSGPGASAKPQKASSKDDFSFMDLDYDDFEEAMREADNGGMNPMGGVVKHSDAPVEHNGLKSGERIKPEVWGTLIDNQGEPAVFTRVHKDLNDVVVVYADPRRMTAEFKLVLSELDRIPKTSLRVATLAVNCDEPSDQRKFLKKNPITSVLLSDPARKVGGLRDTCGCHNRCRLIFNTLSLPLCSLSACLSLCLSVSPSADGQRQVQGGQAPVQCPLLGGCVNGRRAQDLVRGRLGRHHYDRHDYRGDYRLPRKPQAVYGAANRTTLTCRGLGS
jgi:hypothetical protein